MTRLTQTWLAPLALLTLAGCAAPPATFPADVPDPALCAVEREDHFTLYVDRSCLSDDELEALVDELDRARAWLCDWLGPALAPGDFRPGGVPRETCPPDWEFGPAPAVAPIDVVVLSRGGRCHADRDGITVIRDHVPRGDATHELVHFLAGSSWHPIDEGLAVWLTEQLVGAELPLPSRARVYLDLNLRTFLTPRELGPAMNRRDYDVAGAFVGWLIQSFGKARFLQLYAGPARDYMTVYGVGERELVERFWEHVDRLDVQHDGAYYAFKAYLQGRD